MTEYINKHDLITTINKSIEHAKSVRSKKALKMALDMINSYPAYRIDPVTHGKWIHEYLTGTKDGVYAVERCSVCGATEPYLLHENFCPNCGAKIDEVE